MATVSGEQFFGGKVPQAPAQPVNHLDGFSVLDRLKSDFQNRVSNVENIADKYGAGKTGIAGGTLQVAGQAAGFLGDVASEGMKAAVSASPLAANGAPDPFNPLAGKESAPAQALAQWKQQHPEAAANLEAILNVGSVLPVGKVAGTAVEDAALNTASKIPEAVSKTGGILKNAGEKATGIAVSMDEPTKIAMQSYEATQPTLLGRVKNIITGTSEKPGAIKPITEANTAVRLLEPGTEWQLGVHAKKVAGDLWTKTIAPALSATKDKINFRDFIDTLETRIISENADLTRRNALLNALDSFKEDFGKVNQIGLEKLQHYKEGWAKFVPEKAYKGQPIAGNLAEVRKLAAEEARKIIYEKLGGGIKQAYIDYGNLQSIMEAGLKSVDPLRSKGFTKQVWEAVVDKAVTPVATLAGKVLYKTGDGLELLGNAGAKKIKDIIDPPNFSGGAVRQTAPSGTPLNSPHGDTVAPNATLSPKGDVSSPTTASKPSTESVTSTGNAPIGKEGVSAPKADTSVPFDGETLYHGGRDIGDNGTLTFGNYGRVGSGQDSGAIFVTPSKKYASGYVKQDGGALYEANINLNKENVFDATNPKHLQALEKQVGPEGVRMVKDTIQHGAADWATLSQFTQELQDAGFTGAKFLERPAETITPLHDGSFDLKGPPVYSYGMFHEVPVTKHGLSSPSIPKEVKGKPKK